MKFIYKTWLKQMAAQIGVQSLFVACDEAVRVVVSEKVKPFLASRKDSDVNNT